MRIFFKLWFVFGVFILLAGMSIPDKKEVQANRLIKEKSPYLLQHAYNPVNWYPWGDEAFARAKKENKPIFLSIGYLTCHWCHVMAEESFSNSEIAEILNKHFVAIKVDREERPDIDNVYMKAVIAMGASGGWPLTVFLTPDKKPFYGGAYFPPEDRWGGPGFKSVLLSIQRSWQEEREKVVLSADNITQALNTQSHLQANSAVSLDKAVLKGAYKHFKSNFDIDYGGFSYAPKFPTPHNLYFLLRYSKHENNLHSLEMVEKTLKVIAKSAIRDHIGGGFHRYSTDNKCLLPHFEKMLYDQALIARAYLEAYQLTKKQEYREVAEEVLDFVLTQMTDRRGGFYTAYDADSLDPEDKKHKKEGAFYVWGKYEIKNILGKKEAEVFSYYFGIEDNGNIKQDPHGEFGKKNIVYLARTFKETGDKFNIEPVKIEEIINRAKLKLFKVRNNRPRPYLDDKILTDWNGLMISTFSFASRVLNDEKYKQAAEQSAEFIFKNLNKKGELLHRWRGGEAKVGGMIDDYAFFIYGLIDLYEASFKAKYLNKALELTEKMLELFWDEENGGFFFSAEIGKELIFPYKEIYDGALPSGNSIAAMNLLRLGKFTMNEELEKKAEALLRSFATQIVETPIACSQALCALDFALYPSKEIVIAQNQRDKNQKGYIDVIYSDFIPNKIVILRPSEEKELKEISELIPFIKYQQPKENKTTVYVCDNFSCNSPVVDLEELKNLLKK